MVIGVGVQLDQMSWSLFKQRFFQVDLVIQMELLSTMASFLASSLVELLGSASGMGSKN
jgi:hypothetical protein